MVRKQNNMFELDINEDVDDDEDDNVCSSLINGNEFSARVGRMYNLT